MNSKNAVRLVLVILVSMMGLTACRGRARCLASAPGADDVAQGE